MMIVIGRRTSSRTLSALAITWMVIAGSNYCLGWSTSSSTRPFNRVGGEVGRIRTARKRRTSLLRYQEDGHQEDVGNDNNDNNNSNNSPAAEEWMLLSRQTKQHQQQQSPKVNTSFLDPHREELLQWLTTLSGVERSEPLWVGNDLLHVSPSDVLQSRLDSLLSSSSSSTCPTTSSTVPTTTTIKLFSGGGGSGSGKNPSIGVRVKAKFDWDWKYALVQLLSQEEEWTTQHWKNGISNTHPLRLQLVAIPPYTSLQPHVHPAIELDIPLLGTLYEERPTTASSTDVRSTKIPCDFLDRAPHHSLGTPLSDFSDQPTPEELEQIHQDLTDRVSHEYQLQDLFLASKWETNSIRAGESLVNSVGSIHRSFTKEEPCLLFVLGPNVHAHFKE